ncbi:hypothetical protein vseg_016631 [Gypsophila vaccaria]
MATLTAFTLKHPSSQPRLRHIHSTSPRGYSKNVTLHLNQYPAILLSQQNDHARNVRANSAVTVNPTSPAFPENGNGNGVPHYRPNNINSDDKINNVEYLRSLLPGGSWWRLSTTKGDAGEGVVVAKPLTVWNALRKMFVLLANDRWTVFAACFFSILTALSEVSIPHYLSASIFSAQSGQPAIFRQNAMLLVIFCATAGISSGIRGFFYTISNVILVKRMRETLYTSLLRQDVSFFDGTTVGELTSRLGADCHQVSRVIAYDLNLISRNVLQAAGSFAYLFILSWPLGLCSIVICATLSMVLMLYGRYSKKAGKLTQEFTASANGVAQETLSLIRTVRVYGTEEQESGRYNVWLEKLVGISIRQSAAYGLWTFSFNSIYHSMQAIAVLIGGVGVLSGRLSAEQVTKFLLYSQALIQSIWIIGDNVSTLMQSVGASEKVFQLMDLPPSDQFTSEGTKLRKLSGHIDFVNVSFFYPTRPKVKVLREINLSMHPNEVVAIVGLSGSGKSTIVSLLLRLYEPTSGEILVDGASLKTLDINWLRERIGYVGQEPRLFRMDISSNIKYGCPRDVTQEDVEWAAKQAFAHGFITALPNGYNTLVDDDLLSGGQKQRIAIARAVLRDPAILILDEATSALDAESEHNIKGVLSAVKNDSRSKRTVIVIAHRLSTIQAADRIVVMNNGRIVEMGNHTDLVAQDGLYARLTTKQADLVA